ncbi:hypothetical protein H4219_000020 [Mycoemilia scoparia]|uniref:RNA polymerase II-associated factor 1 homolog n=1 Tax=Mycoemilia scoparia TaxID=417184 RepID=A0A9W8ABH3_9FUNG|nr:hypothetical protein H4219_000020 [Mycoemilia scoparia]
MAHPANKKRKVGSEFICRIRYHNPLPSVPFPPKLLPVPPTYVNASGGNIKQAKAQRHYQYKHTTLDEAIPLPYYVDSELGVPIEPCLLGAFDENQEELVPKELDPEDQFLLSLPELAKSATNKAGQSTSNLSTLGKSYHSATLASRQAHGLSQASSGKGAQNIPEDFTVDKQIRAIEQTFDFFAEPEGEDKDKQKTFLESLRHPTNPKLQATEMYQLLPNEEQWANTYSVLIYESLPHPKNIDNLQEMSCEERNIACNKSYDSAFVRMLPLSDQYGKRVNWIEHYLPVNSKETQNIAECFEEADRGLQPVGKKLEFEKHYTYNFPVDQKATKQDQCLFTFHESTTEPGDGGVASNMEIHYLPIIDRVLLKRQRRNEGNPLTERIDQPTKMVVNVSEHTKVQQRERTRRVTWLDADALPVDTPSEEELDNDVIDDSPVNHSDAEASDISGENDGSALY